jgi:hypothetical protein
LLQSLSPFSTYAGHCRGAKEKKPTARIMNSILAVLLLQGVRLNRRSRGSASASMLMSACTHQVKKAGTCARHRMSARQPRTVSRSRLHKSSTPVLTVTVGMHPRESALLFSLAVIVFTAAVFPVPNNTPRARETILEQPQYGQH